MTPEERSVLSDRFRLASLSLSGAARTEFIEILRRAFSPSSANQILSARAVSLWITPPGSSQKRNFLPRNAVENDDFNARVFFCILWTTPLNIPGGDILWASGSRIDIRARRFESLVYESEAYGLLQDNMTGARMGNDPDVDDGEPRIAFLTANLSGVDTRPDTIEGEYDDPLPD